ncbi:phosphoribulokinase [Candidatus Gottesmanbacteria bacterium RBG_13_45_10]|uniref:phosphoribulokinase n=1 Tax=Candidatus Gottesmanbacteria bacterium RBG_13_45_10 TaxID=1798370 RepID=A0A1F5ZFU0_9BACT|nr:MAG: phosphoribulokinase [Candidatus Gottesmanbacteria bacterium RBG_13_45_10]
MSDDAASCSFLQSQLTKLQTPFVIGIAGDSGSGKTIFSDGIRRILGPNLIRTITMDGYHKENRAQRSVSGRLPLDPGANKFELLLEHLRLLRSNSAAEIPQYNHATGDFEPSKKIEPAPIIIIEGLHALYPEFLELLDYKIFVDPCREIKWEWKFARDVAKRGHRAEKLEEEMLAREAAYKRWIDFQKINADIVIKIFPTRMKEFARYDFINPLPNTFYNVELIIKPSSLQLPSIKLPFNLSQMISIKTLPFLLAATACRYWGKSAVDIHIDGAFPQETIAALEAHITECTAIKIDHMAAEGNIPQKPEEEMLSSTDLTQLIVAWQFLEAVRDRLTMKEKGAV